MSVDGYQQFGNTKKAFLKQEGHLKTETPRLPNGRAANFTLEEDWSVGHWQALRLSKIAQNWKGTN